MGYLGTVIGSDAACPEKISGGAALMFMTGITSFQWYDLMLMPQLRWENNKNVQMM